MLLTNKNAHDIKNFILAVASYIDKQEPEKAKEKMERFCKKIPSIENVDYGNDAVNALFYSKETEIKKEIPKRQLTAKRGQDG